MDELRELFRQMLDQNIIQIVLSNTRDAERAAKVKVRPVMIRGELCFQETPYQGTKVFHSNHAGEEMQERLTEYMRDLFRQAQLNGAELDATVLVSKKGAVSIKRKRHAAAAGQSRKAPDLAHDRARQYLLKDGEPVDFLVHLGVQTPDGRVVKARYDKFRQINRYLEFIEDVIDVLPADRTIRICLLYTSPSPRDTR